MEKSGEIVNYGGIAMVRAYCSDCDSMAFIRAGVFKCCGKPAHEGTVKVNRAVREGPGVAGKRKYFKLPINKRLEILKNQNWLCLYCLLPFQFTEIRDRKSKRYRMLRIEWDHFVPWAFSTTNKTDFVAACQICNGIKWSLVFSTVEEARAHIQERWNARYEICRILEGAPAESAVSAFKPREEHKSSAQGNADSSGT